jgi:phage gpG-like protein
MSDRITIDVSDIVAFASRSTNAPRIVADETKNAMERSAIIVQNAARSNIQQQGAIDTGRLLGSITRDVSPTEAQIGTNVTYAPTVEDGRRSGAPMPPSGALLDWMRRHGIPAESEFVVRRAIARRGIKARPFLLPALTNNLTQIEREFEAALSRVAARVLP